MFLAKNKITFITYQGSYDGHFLTNCLLLTDKHSFINNNFADHSVSNMIYYKSRDRIFREALYYHHINKMHMDYIINHIVASLDKANNETKNSRILLLTSQIELAIRILFKTNIRFRNQIYFNLKTGEYDENITSSLYVMNHFIEAILPIDAISTNINQILIVTETDKGKEFIKNQFLLKKRSDHINSVEEDNTPINSTTMNNYYKEIFQIDHWEPQHTIDLPTFLCNNDFDAFNNWLEDFHYSSNHEFYQHPRLREYWDFHQTEVVKPNKLVV
jgi:hypothetical protein